MGLADGIGAPTDLAWHHVWYMKITPPEHPVNPCKAHNFIIFRQLLTFTSL